MKVIDLLNKIANGEEVPKKIKYDGEEYKITKILLEDNNYYFNYINEDMECIFPVNTNHLNDEVEILEEEKKIPEKFDYCEENTFMIKCKENSYLTREEIILLDSNFKAICNKINAIIDYLKSKGE